MQPTRRKLFTSGTDVLITVPAVWILGGTLAGCSEEECGDPNRITQSSTAVTYTSSCEGGHSHTFTVMMTELTMPPATGIARDTSSYEGQHVHHVTLTEADLAEIQGGATVTKQTSVVEAHLHSFMFRRAET